MLVSRNNIHNNDQALRSSKHSFHLEKGAFFSKDSDIVANPSKRECGEGGLFLRKRKKSFNKVSRQTESEAGEVHILNRAQLFNMECAGNLKSIKDCFPFPPFISMKKKDPSVSM